MVTNQQAMRSHQQRRQWANAMSSEAQSTMDNSTWTNAINATSNTVDHDTTTYSFHDSNNNAPWSLGQPDTDNIIDGNRVETRSPNMQLLVEEDIKPYVGVNFNTPAMIDAIVDDINQKRIEQGVPQADFLTRPPPPRYTRQSPSNRAPDSSSFEPLMTYVTNRTLPSTANVTFADISTTVDDHSAKKKRLELAIIAVQEKDISKHLQKVGRQSKATTADDIRNSGSIDGRVLQDFANDYQNCTAAPPTNGGPYRIRKKLREKFFVAFNAYQEVQKESSLPPLTAADYFDDLDALTALTTGHTAKKRLAQDKVTNSSVLSNTTYTHYTLTGLRGDLVTTQSELKPLTSSDVCDLRITSSHVVIGILMR
jgi:hypothetical protein